MRRVGEEMTSQKPVFVRQASGLVRVLSSKDALLMNLTVVGYGIGAVYFTAPVMAGYLPGADFWIASLLAAIAGIAVTATYAHFVSAMPRSGGEYVFLSRIVHPLVGFLVNWGISWLMLLCSTVNSPVAGGMLLALLQMGVELGPFWWSATGQFLVAILMMVVALLIAVVGLRYWIYYQNLTVILTLFSNLAFIGILLSIGNPQNFADIFNRVAAPLYTDISTTPFNYVIEQAKLQGWQPFVGAPFSLSNTIAMVAVYGWSGLLTSTYVSVYMAGEMKNAESGRNQLFGLTGALLLNAGVLIYEGFLLLSVMGPDWLGAAFYTQYDPNVFRMHMGSVAFPFTLLPYIANPAAAGLVILGLMLFAISWIVMDFTIYSRCLFAWSFDRLVPTRLAEVNPRFGTPLRALLVGFGLAVSIQTASFLTGVSYYSVLSSIGWFSFIAASVVGLTAVVFPFTRKRLYELMPLKSRVGPIPVLSILGMLTAVLFIPLALVYVWWSDYARVLGVWSSGTSAFLALAYISAILIYFGSKAYWKAKGIQIEATFKEIPPA